MFINLLQYMFINLLQYMRYKTTQQLIAKHFNNI